MARPSHSVEAMVRHAFGLVLEIRSRKDAKSLLTQAISFLRLLLEEPSAQASSMVVSVRAVRIRDG